MAFCVKCGFQLKEDSLFCGRCGTKVERQEEKAVCLKCGAELREGTIFCEKCGNKLKTTTSSSAQQVSPRIVQPDTPSPSTGYSVVISRESSFAGAMTGVTVVVNGINQGSISSGQSKTINVSSPEAVIELKAMGVKSARIKLRLKDNARIDFKQQASIGWNKIVFGSVTGADILEKS